MTAPAPRSRTLGGKRATLVLGVLLALTAPDAPAHLVAQEGEAVALLTTGEPHHHDRDARPADVTEPGAEIDAVTAADSGELEAPAPPPRDYDALRAELPEALRALSPVVLADELPLAWWSEVTDSWLLEPARQRRRMPRRCRTRGGYREHCSGARVVPTATGEAAAIASYFGLGERGTAMVMMHRASFEPWLALAEGDDDETRLTFPVPTGHMGRGFGFTRTGELRRRRHQGVDIGAPIGSPVVAARSGIVVYSDNYITGYGNMVMILHEDGDSTFYAHCRATFVAAGERVERGQRIAEVGRTGFAGGPHLHFELRHNGAPRDPRRRFLPRDEPEPEGELEDMGEEGSDEALGEALGG